METLTPLLIVYSRVDYPYNVETSLQVISISVTGACLLEKLLNIRHTAGNIAEVPRFTFVEERSYE